VNRRGTIGFDPLPYDVGMKHNHIPVGENRHHIPTNKLGPHPYGDESKLKPYGTTGFGMNV